MLTHKIHPSFSMTASIYTVYIHTIYTIYTVNRHRVTAEWIGTRNYVPMAFTVENPPAQSRSSRQPCHSIYSGRQTCERTSRGHTEFLHLPSAVLNVFFKGYIHYSQATARAPKSSMIYNTVLYTTRPKDLENFANLANRNSIHNTTKV